MRSVAALPVICDCCVCRYNVQLDAADSSEGSFRTSSSGCDVDCPSSSSLAAGGESSSSHHQQLSCSSLPSTDVTASPPRPRCHGNAGECGDWESQRWRHWQRLAMTCDRETDEQLTLVWLSDVIRSFVHPQSPHQLLRHAEIISQLTVSFDWKTLKSYKRYGL